MISVGGVVVLGDAGGGASLPTASAAGEVPLADGAGTAYTAGALLLAGTDLARPAASVAYLGRSYFATDIGPAGAVYTCVTDGLGDYDWSAPVLALDAEVAGTTQISDGAGAPTTTSADVSAMLAAANAADARTAIGLGAVTATGATAAAVAAIVDAGRVTTPSLVSEVAGGWTPDSVLAPGQVTVTGGEIVTSYTGASTTANAGGFESRAWPSSVGPEYTFTARFEIANNTGAATVAYANVGYTGGGIFYWLLRASGTANFSANLAGENAALVSGVTLPVDGTGWVRFRVRGTRVTVWTGVGVGATAPVASAWTLRYDGDRSQLSGRIAPTTMLLGGSQRDATSVGATTTYRWSQITIRDLSDGLL